MTSLHKVDVGIALHVCLHAPLAHTRPQPEERCTCVDRDCSNQALLHHCSLVNVMWAGEVAAKCDGSPALESIPVGLSTHPVLLSYPCGATATARMWHVVQRGTCFNPVTFVLTRDIAMMVYVAVNIPALLLALAFPR